MHNDQGSADPTRRPRLPSPFDEPDPAREEAAPAAADDPAPTKTRFSIRFLMLVTLVVAVATAGFHGMNLGGGRRAGAVLFTLLAPLALLLVVSLLRDAWRRR